MSSVDFAAGGISVQPGVQPLPGQLAGKHHGVSDWAVRAVRIRHAVKGNGCGVKVALPVNAGGIDKLLVLGDALGGLQILAEKCTDRLEIEVDNAVGLGQQ